jgi:hypothetical protein
LFVLEPPSKGSYRGKGATDTVTPSIENATGRDTGPTGFGTTTEVLGRADGLDAGATLRLGVHRAPDGSDGGPVALDIDRPHVGLVVGKRGYGKSYTLGVLAEGLARAPGVAPVVVDPVGVFDTLARRPENVPATVESNPVVTPGALGPPAWCETLGLDPESTAGTLVWSAAANAETLSEMCAHVSRSDAPEGPRWAASNHLSLADDWGVFGADGLDPVALGDGAVTVLDVSGYGRAPANALVRGVADALYAARVEGTVDRLPWLLVDEAHVFFDGVADGALRTLLTRGRRPGVSCVLATQRPEAVPDVVTSQADLTVAHRLTARADRRALERARPAYADAPVDGRTPTVPGEATVVDDATETVHTVRVRERDTPHGGASPRASAVTIDDRQG